MLATTENGSPLEIPRLVITPSTPTDDPPIPQLGFGRGRRPTLFRSQSLLDQIDQHNRIQNPTIPTMSTTRRSSRLEKDKDKMQGHHHLSPFPLHSSSTNMITARQNRPGRGTAVSLLLVGLAFMLVISSALFSSETVTGLLHSEKQWMASDRVEWIATGTNANARITSESESESAMIDEIIHPQLELQPSHYEEDDDSNDGHGGDPMMDHLTELDTGTEVEVEHHTTTGPALTNDAWRSYLKRKDQVTGQAGPTAHFEAWDFH